MKRSFSITLVLVIALLVPVTSLQAASPSISVIAVAAGSSHSMALCSDGSVWTWGDNSFGQLGNGKVTLYKNMTNISSSAILSNNDSYIPAKVSSLTDITAVAAGSGFSMALNSSGELYVWGSNNLGQLGDGSTTNRLVPTKTMDGIASIAAGGNSAAAVDKDGVLWRWGRDITTLEYDSSLQSYPYFTTPVKVQGGVSKAVVGSSDYLLFLTEDGDLLGMGSNSYLGIRNQLSVSDYPDLINAYIEEPMLILRSIADIAVGSQTAYALDMHGQLFGWGANGSNGSVGSGSSQWWLYEPELVSQNVKQVFPGNMLLKEDNSLWIWGDIFGVFSYRHSDNGQTFDGGGQVIGDIVIYGNRPQRLLSDIKVASGSSFHYLAVDLQGKVYAWGNNEFGALGTGECSLFTLEEREMGIYDEYQEFDLVIIADHNHALPTVVLFADRDETSQTPSPETITLSIGSSAVFRGGERLAQPPLSPQIISGRTMLPFRYLVQTVLGGEVDYVAATRTITATLGEHEVIMVVDRIDISVDGVLYDYGQAPVVIDGNTLVPLRAFERIVNDLSWNPETQTVTVIP